MALTSQNNDDQETQENDQMSFKVAAVLCQITTLL